MTTVLIASRKASAERASWQNRVRWFKVEERFEACGVLQGDIPIHFRSDLLGCFCARDDRLNRKLSGREIPMMMGSPP